jgi:hypothetical protein
LADANFFSVATIPPLRWAAFRADFPLTTVSRGPAAPPRVRLPILVTEFQSSDISNVVLERRGVRVVVVVCGRLSWARMWGAVLSKWAFVRQWIYQSANVKMGDVM